jgi:hypothetical protein
MEGITSKNLMVCMDQLLNHGYYDIAHVAYIEGRGYIKLIG